VRAQADALWQVKLVDYTAKGLKFWDGDFYRVENLQELRDSSEANKLNFELGIVKYRYVNTVKDLYEYYEHHPESWPQHLAIGALLRTIDNYWVFGVRGSGSVEVGTQDIIGGGMTATELVVNDANGMRQVLFKELHEEAGIKPEHVSTMQGIGIVCSPSAYIIILVETKLNVSRKQLAEIFLGKEDDEMADLVFIKDAEVRDYLKTLPGFRPLVAELLD